MTESQLNISMIENGIKRLKQNQNQHISQSVLRKNYLCERLNKIESRFGCDIDINKVINELAKYNIIVK